MEIEYSHGNSRTPAHCRPGKPDFDKLIVSSLPEQLDKSSSAVDRIDKCPAAGDPRERHVVDEPEQINHVALARHVCADQNVATADILSVTFLSDLKL